MNWPIYSTQRLHHLKTKSRMWRQLALATLAFDVLWFLWLRPTFFPSPISFSLLLIQLSLILAPALCLVLAWGISLERIFHSGLRPNTIWDRLAVIAFIIFLVALALYCTETLLAAVLNGQIPTKRSVIESAISPTLFLLFFLLWLFGAVGSALGAWFGLYFFRHGNFPPNPTLKRDALKRAP